MENMSFRGEDTRDAFTSHLHKALLGKNIDTYIDNRLGKGDDIGPTLLEAIEKSKLALVIFSKDYASSTWCLKELVHILGCKKSYGQIVIPIFYRIDPSHVRKQQGTYALEDRPLKRSRDEVANWRAALEEAANMSGFHYSSKTGTEADFVEKVVQDVLTKLNRESSSDLKGLVGIEKKIEKIESLLCLDSRGVCCVGIWGMGGIGKTTLAGAVFHRHSSKFEVCCFLANVRENSEQTNGLHQLRNKLVGEILKQKDVNIDTPSIPLNILIRLRRTKALIVLDDVNARKQLEYLVGDHDWFCQGSRIIITARDKGILEQKVDHEKIYNVEGLGSDEALELFHSHAFGNKSLTTDYTEFSREVVDYIKGIPLALKVMGSSFRRCKSKQEWEAQWKKVKRVPIGEIQEVLGVSYDGLDDNGKEIFLDIACFHKGCRRNDVERMLDGCDFFGEAGINDLIDRSLVSISKNGYWNGMQLEIHDLVQEMGRAIAREQRSRLFIGKDVYQVLTNNQKDGHVQAISFDWYEIKKLHLELEHANFEKMYELRFLRVSRFLPSMVSLDLPNSLRFLQWDGYPLKSLPSKFSAQNLVVLDMSSNEVEVQLWNENQSPVNLKRISLRFCEYLTEVPNLSRSLNIEHINLPGCKSLVEIPSYFQHLNKLTYLNLVMCNKLKNLAEMPCNLEYLNLSWTAIEELPSSIWSHEKISHLDIKHCRHLKSLPSNSCKLKLSNSFSLEGCESLCEFWELPWNTTVLELSGTTIKELRNKSIKFVGLTAIKLINCKSLVSLPTNIWKLKYLESLDLSRCSNLEHFPEISEAMEHLEFLNLSFTAVKELPPSIGNLVELRKLDLGDCNNLVSLPTNIWKLKSLESLDLSRCSNLEHFPEISEAMEHLEFLNLWSTAVKEVTSSIGNLVALRKLDLGDCSIQEIPDDLFCLTSLQELTLSFTEIKSIPASVKQAAQLSRLFLNGCKSLESLPEFPPLLQHLEADGCTSLKTVSSSSTAITQGWEEYIFYLGLSEKHNFSNCPKLDENARSNIMGDAQLRIMRMAIASSEFKEDKIEQPSYHSDNSYYDFEESLRKRSFVAIRCCGNEIPKWFSHKSEGCSIKIELPGDWFSTDFLGFALSIVVAKDGFSPHAISSIECKYNFKTSNGESHEVNHPLCNLRRDTMGFESIDSYEVFVLWYNNVFEEVVEGAQSPTAFFKLVTEVNVDFIIRSPYDSESYSEGEEVEEEMEVKVEKCGICLLYGKDAEMIKQRAL
ncbi:hypothetical protein PRUPE_8G179500 [Prunus persica]|uniref:ADP-ribosyl cyclase/cyclic ADP-ribose hydrolase n=1 Tax=Prunus persica TaxID=3760 RepID=A0A251MZK6_PRUPE|nr:hypothetical protein PRUPE_8G179500 [Prunus persica]